MAPLLADASRCVLTLPDGYPRTVYDDDRVVDRLGRTPRDVAALVERGPGTPAPAAV